MGRRKFKFRDHVRCNVTGFEGVVTAYSEYLTGCEQYCVKPAKLDKEGKMYDGVWIDQDRLDLVKKTKPGRVVERTGGPQMDTAPTC